MKNQTNDQNKKNEQGKEMDYFTHLKANWRVASNATLQGRLVMALFHFAHGIVPVRWTEHTWWGINPHKDH